MKTEIQETELYKKFKKALNINHDMRPDDNPFVVACCEITKEYANNLANEIEALKKDRDFWFAECKHIQDKLKELKGQTAVEMYVKACDDRDAALSQLKSSQELVTRLTQELKDSISTKHFKF